MVTASALCVFSLSSFVVYATLKFWKRRSRINTQTFPQGYHVVISGGSKGIGKALAVKYAELGADVTILARRINDLNAAKDEIKAKCLRKEQIINSVSVDLINITFPDKFEDKYTNEQAMLIDQILGKNKRVDIIVNCCGNSIPGTFENLSGRDFKFMMDVNYFSAVNLTRLLLNQMKESTSFGDQGKRIVFVSSMCGILSFYGFSAYAASKFALVGLAEALNMELVDSDISVTVSFPADTQTPGFDEENKVKPDITKKLSETSHIFSPEEVATSLVEDVKNRKFFSTVGFENKAALAAINSFMPSSIYYTLINIFFAPLLRIVGFCLVFGWYATTKKMLSEEKARKNITKNMKNNVKS